ncbi:MAG: DUF1269 domain-containing protein [Gammaproteobacteria bacterium]|nr:DUF1269 domain-containing protein [Gammaproteobacteria bacterium]MBL7000144.1 DUF1269 domain-containing protein [Gammaproteobacteria bacterium]
MRRINFLIPSLPLTEVIIAELQQQGIAASHLHVVASIEYSLKGFPQATIWQRTELASGLIWGTILGGLAGFSGSLFTLLFPPGGLELGLNALLIGTLAGIGFGVVILGLVKGHEHNHQLDNFKREIDHGDILLMVDTPKTEVERISNSILQHHPTADIRISQPQ